MSKTPKVALQKFLINLVEKPKVLNQIQKNPHIFITKSALAESHKKILLGKNVKKIKSLVASAVAGPNFTIQIHSDTTAQSTKPQLFQIHFGAGYPNVKVRLGAKNLKLKGVKVAGNNAAIKGKI